MNIPTQLKYALESERNRTERFIQLYARNQQSLFSYVLALVPQWTDAVSVMEATHLVLWRRFEQYQIGTNFSEWATKEAKGEVLKYRDRRKKEWLCFSADVVSKLDHELHSMDGMLQHQREILPICLAKLPERPRVMLYHRYRDNASVHQVAEKMSCADSTVRMSLQRIRHALLGCVTRRMPAEETTTPKRLSTTQALEVETLCSALFDGSITPDQFRLLQVYLRISASSRQLYIQYRNLHGALAAACAYEVLLTHSFSGMPGHDDLVSEDEKCETENPISGTRGSSSSTMAKVPISTEASVGASTLAEQNSYAIGRQMLVDTLAIATKHMTATSLSTASLVTMLVLLILAAFTPPGRGLFEQLTNTEPFPTSSIARLIKTQDCQWEEPAGAPAIGAELAMGQQLKLVKGLVEIKYRDGAQVILQGPVDYEMSQLGRSYLTSGKMSAIIPKSAIGFTVETPNARVVDMGTEFAVEVRPDERSEIHVFRGRVEAQRLNESGPTGEWISLTAGKAARFEFGTEQKSIPTFAANEARYQRTMDRVARMAAKKALWRKDTKRLRLDPDLVLYYTFAGTGDNQREFTNQATATKNQFPCVLTGHSENLVGLTQVRGKWPWSAALNFAGDVDKYLRVETSVDSGDVLSRPGPTMSLVATIGSLEATIGSLEATIGSLKVTAGNPELPSDEKVADGNTASVSATILSGPILMNRRSHSKDIDFQLALLPSVDRDHSERIEFRLNRTFSSDSQVDGEADRRTSDTLQVPQEGQHNTSSRDIVLSGEVDLAQQPWHLVVVVCDQVSVRLYWNGNQVGEQLLNEPLALQLEEFLIGHGNAVSPEGKIREVGFAGLIDDLAVFKRPLKESEIQYMAELY